jgi:hypothetical protein
MCIYAIMKPTHEPLTSRAPVPDPARSPRYWFPAKTYGWGWGFPCTWEGWGVLGVYLGLLLALIVLVPADRHPTWFWAGVGTLIATFIAICWWRGEPPKWLLLTRRGRSPHRIGPPPSA